MGPRLDSPRRFRLRVTQGPSTGLTVNNDGPQLSVGSAPGNDLVLKDPLVSNRHLLVRWSNGSYWARCAGPNEECVGHPAELRHGTELMLGATTLVFELFDRPQLRRPAKNDCANHPPD
jgi:pSer/pThr/pTyr-binding forkhead associated (FHA) protein